MTDAPAPAPTPAPTPAPAAPVSPATAAAGSVHIDLSTLLMGFWLFVLTWKVYHIGTLLSGWI